jgi:hypothetical protein
MTIKFSMGSLLEGFAGLFSPSLLILMFIGVTVGILSERRREFPPTWASF